MLARNNIRHRSRIALPRVLVVGHERSGVQFLLDSLACNFGYCQADQPHLVAQPTLDTAAPRSDVALAHLPGHWSSGLLKSHYEFGFYQDWLRRYESELRILYVTRDVVSVLRSYQRHLCQVDHFEGPCVLEGSQFIRTTPSGAMLRFQYERAATMVHRWANHVQGWLDGISKHRRLPFMLLRHDSLNEDFNSTMRATANFLGLPTPSYPVRPRMTVSTSANRRMGPLPDFRLSDDDLEFIGSITNPAQELVANWGRTFPIS